MRKSNNKVKQYLGYLGYLLLFKYIEDFLDMEVDNVVTVERHYGGGRGVYTTRRNINIPCIKYLSLDKLAHLVRFYKKYHKLYSYQLSLNDGFPDIYNKQNDKN